MVNLKALKTYCEHYKHEPNSEMVLLLISNLELAIEALNEIKTDQWEVVSDSTGAIYRGTSAPASTAISALAQIAKEIGL